MTKVRSYRIDVDEYAKEGDAIVIGTCGGMTSQHLGTAASFDAGCSAGNIPVVNNCGVLPDVIIPSGAMKKSVYDPTNKNADAFDYCNFSNTPEIPVVNDPVVTFKQGGVTMGSISLNQVGTTEIELLAGGVTAGNGIDILNNEVSVDYDDTSIGLNTCDKLEVKDYSTIVSGAAAGATAVQADDLATVAMTGNYCDLINKPEIPSAQIQSDWEQTNTNLPDYIKNKPTIGNATITLQKNGTNVDCFELNQTANKCINIILSKDDVGLTNVDNTSDLNKPISTATQTALNCKQDNIADLNTIRSNACAGKCANDTIATYGDIVTHDSCEYATAEQGGKADSAVQPADLCTVATTGLYCDLSGKPVLCAVATSGKYCDLSGIPALCNVALSGAYCDLTGTPALCDVALSGCYNDLSGTPLLCAIATSAKYCDILDTPVLCPIATSGKYCDITGTPNLCTVATSGKYCDLTGKPTIPTDNCQLANSCGYTTCTGTLVDSDLQPYAKTCDLAAYAQNCELCTVAKSGCYCDLSGTPHIPTDNCELGNSCGYTTCTGTLVSSDLEPYATTASLCTVATTGKYCDLTGKPTIPTDNCQLANSCGYITNAVNDLTNYYLKCETYQKCEVDNLISNFGGFEVVSVLPTTGIKTNVIYLLGPIGTGADKYEEWIYYNNTWTKIGETTTDLSNYAKCCDIPTNNNQLTNGCGYTTCTGTLVASDLTPYAKTCTLCAVATSGKYCDLSGLPTIPTDNCQLSNSCGYTTCTGTLVSSDLTPYTKCCDLKTVATTGCYCDLTGKPTIPTDNCQLGNSCGYTTCTGTLVSSDLAPYAKSCDLKTVATSGKYCDLTGTPTIPTNNNQLTNGCGYTTCTGTLVSSDLQPYAKTCDLKTVATSGKYCDLIDKPDLSVYSLACNMATTLDGADNTHYPTTLAVANALGSAGYGDMLKATYDPCNKESNAFDYNNFINTPLLCAVATSGLYCDLSGAPSLCAVATSGCYNDLTGKPSLATVATSGKYCDLTGKPTIPTDNCQLGNGCNYITKDVNNLTCYTPTASLATVATSGAYCDLTGKPTLSCVACTGCYDDLSGKPNLGVYQTTANMVCTLVDADNSHYPSAKTVADALSACGAGDMLKATYDPCNKNANAFDYNNFINKPSLCAVATSGKYCDLTGTPTIPAALSAGNAICINSNCINVVCDNSSIKKNGSNQLYADFTGLATTSSLCTVATSGKYCDLTGTPTIPTDNCQLANSCGYTTCTGTLTSSDLTPYAKCCILCTVATSGKYCDLTGTPTIPAQLTSGTGICIDSNKVNAQNLFIISEDDIDVTYTGEKGVSPYNTSYCYTNVCIDPNSGVKWIEGAQYMFNLNTKVATSACRNVRLKIGSGDYIPLMGTSSAAAGSSYFVKSAIRPFQYSTKYISTGGLHVVSDTNTTYSAITCAEAVTGTCTCVRGVAASTLKNIVPALSVDDTAYASSWNGVTNRAPSKNAVYDKISTIDTCLGGLCTVAKSGKYCDLTGQPTIPTDNCQLANSCGYTTCTGTLTSSSLKTINGCCIVGSGDVCIQGGVTSVNTRTGAVTVSEFCPTSAGSTGQYLTKTSGGYDWATLGGGDMCYSDFNRATKSGATVTLDLNSTITPSANFTVNKPSTIKEGQAYVLRVTNGATAYTMTLGSGITNPFGEDLTLTANGTDQFVFLATSSSTMELQSSGGSGENVFVTEQEYEALLPGAASDGKTYFIYE